MSSTPLVHVMPASDAQAADARRLRLGDGQAAYAGDVAFNVDHARAAADCDAMVVVHRDAVIGFYRLDYLPTVVARQTLDRRTVTLRAFALDVAWQSQGLGRQAIDACCADLALRHPDRRLLALNVHVRNVVACRMYRSAGFVDCGEILPGGNGGPQRLLLRALGMGELPP